MLPLTFEYGPDRTEFWNDYVENVGFGISSADEYDRFLNDQQHLGNLFDTWANPYADDDAQARAYGEFWEILEEYGLDLDSFDWQTFRELYG